MLVTAVAVAARICAKTAVEEVFAHRERKLVSCRGGWAFLYRAGRWPVRCGFEVGEGQLKAVATGV